MVKPRFRPGVSAAERKQQRQQSGKLKDILISKHVLKRYTAAVFAFTSYLLSLGLTQSRTWDGLDRQISKYLEHLWQEGEAKGLAADTLCGVQHHLSVRRKFTGSWRLYSAWV